MARLTLEGLSFTYPDAKAPALCNVDLRIEDGEFLTLMGATGSGKSTLLRLLKPELRQNGTLSGRVLLDGKDIGGLTARESASAVGFVAQNPEEQIVTDKVWHELAFTLESLGARRELIARRIAEIAAFFDIEPWLDRETATLSGGQKQLLNLAAVMTADPEALILDEPTAQLDPIAASRFIDTLHRLNRETGLTVIISEHRAEELIPISDRLLILEEGRIAFCDTPKRAASALKDTPYLRFLTASARIFAGTDGAGEAPLSVREGQAYVNGLAVKEIQTAEKTAEQKASALSLKNVYFRYERRGADVLSDLDLEVKEGEIFALLGRNGAGKSTMAAVAAGLRRAYSGSVRVFSKRLKDYTNGSLYQGVLSLLPQDTESVFLRETVREELRGCEKAEERLPFDFKPLYDRHPFDLSGGERQLVALCKALSTNPRLLILDEPSKGLDGNMKALFCDVLKGLKREGVTVLMISHDVEFAALCADRCALFSQGRIAAADETETFLFENRFYTTAASRITRQKTRGGYTVERAVKLLGGAGC